jgi:hypothetical protein
MTEKNLPETPLENQIKFTLNECKPWENPKYFILDEWLQTDNETKELRMNLMIKEPFDSSGGFCISVYERKTDGSKLWRLKGGVNKEWKEGSW